MDGSSHTSQTKNGDSLLKTTTWGKRVALLTLFALLVARLAFADGTHKLSPDLDALKGSSSVATVDVIIQFTETPTTTNHQNVQSKGGVLKRKLDFIKAATIPFPLGPWMPSQVTPTWLTFRRTVQ